jgi:hypothetical protein
VIFDNVKDMTELREHWPADSTGDILITSRNALFPESYITLSLSLQPFSEIDSREFFLRVIGVQNIDGLQTEIDTLLRSWDGLPLALSQMGNIIREDSMPLTEFCQLYNENASDLLQEKGSDRWNYEHSVATAFSVAYLKDESKTLIRSLTFFDPDKIPQDIIKRSFKHESAYPGLKNEFR